MCIRDRLFPVGRGYSGGKGNSVFLKSASSSLRFCEKSPPSIRRVVFPTKNLHTTNTTFLRHQNNNDRPDGKTHNLKNYCCLLYTSPSPRDRTRSRMPSS